MQLQLATWQEVDTYLERSRGVIIPIGPPNNTGLLVSSVPMPSAPRSLPVASPSASMR